MFKPRALVAAALFLAFGISLPAMGWQRHQMSSTYQAEANNERHPETVEHYFTVPADFSAPAWICTALDRQNFKSRVISKGNLKIEHEVRRFNLDFESEPEIENLTARANVKNGQLVACAKSNEDLTQDDIIHTTIHFNKAPRLKSEGDELASFRIFNRVVSQKQDAENFFSPVRPDTEPTPGWHRHQMTSTYQAEADNEPHPESLEHYFTVPADFAAPAWICSALKRENFNDRSISKGNLKVEHEIARFEGDFENEPQIENLTARANVKNGQLVVCARSNKDLVQNDVIHSTFHFNKAPRLKSEGDEPVSFRVFNRVTRQKQNGENFFAPEPPDEEPAPDSNDDPDPGPGPNPNPNPPPSGSDRAGVESLRGCASGGVGVQFRWEGGRIYIDRRAPGGSISSAGPYNSLGAAGTDAARRWSCGPGTPVSTADANELPRLLAWGGVGGGRLLALRFERSNGASVYVDAYSRGIGAIHGSPFSTVGSAIRNFCGRSNISC